MNKKLPPRFYLWANSVVCFLFLAFSSIPNVFSAEATQEIHFRHPGILANKAQLDFVRQKIKSNEEPWSSAFKKMKNSEFGKLSYRPHANYATVKCGSYSKPNIGCSQEREDALAAYTQALLWYMTGDRRHAENAIFIMDQWARTLTGGHQLANARLQTGWAGVGWAEAGELILHTYDGWSSDKVARFKRMLVSQYIPLLKKGALDVGNGNWNLIISQALISNAVFLEDKELFFKAIDYWNEGLTGYIYMKKDGAYPYHVGGRGASRNEMIQIWHGQHDFMEGVAQETCRDLSHTTWGIVSAVNIAEIALQQGINVYAYQADRLKAGIEFHTKYLMGERVPGNLCGGHLEMGNYSTWEVAYNHFHNRLRLPMPNTERYINAKMRPTGEDGHYIAWETLTHAGVGMTGINIETTGLKLQQQKLKSN